jgi:hypothetical protein
MVPRIGIEAQQELAHGFEVAEPALELLRHRVQVPEAALEHAVLEDGGAIIQQASSSAFLGLGRLHISLHSLWWHCRQPETGEAGQLEVHNG